MFKFSKLLLIAMVVWIFPSFCLASEKISSFDVDINVNTDSSIDVTETIEYDFGKANRHGIYRTIPIKYKARGGNYALRIDNISVTDLERKPYSFTKSKGRDLEIKIGEADKFVAGVKTYVISYRVRKAINYFDDHDELYWNATGDEWGVPIEHASTTVFLPELIKEEEIQENCFVGSLGSTTPCFNSSKTELGGKTALVFDHNTLGLEEGMTVVVGVPKGVIYEPSAGEKILAVVIDNWVVGVPIVVFIFLLTLWWKKGRDPAGRGTIVTQFDAPDGLTPSQVGTIIDERADNADLSADIVNLAVQGYLKINRLEVKKMFGTKTDYRLDKLHGGGGIKEEFQRELLGQLFKKGRKEVKLSSLKNKFYKDLANIRKMVYKSMVKKKYFVQNPERVRLSYRIIGIAILVVGDVVGIMAQNFIAIGSFSLAGILIIGFSFAMPVKTKRGVIVREHVLGLKRYLSVAEKERLKFHNAPEKSPEHFDKLLPFAMVLGVEKEWAKQFEGIYREEPSWYSGTLGRPFVASVFVSDMSEFSTAANSTLNSRPSSAAGGGSGFSGGGAGGGFGGGGGGSW
jgi:uncharacterized membrane protein